LEVQDRGNRFLFQQSAKRLDVFLPDSARYGQNNDIFLSQDPINSAAHRGDIFPDPNWAKPRSSVRRMQSGDHSQVLENKTLVAPMSDENIANVADFAGFVDFAKRSATARTVQIRRYQCYRNLNWSLLIFKALILLASVDAGM